MEQEGIVFKGTKNGFTIIFNEAIPVDILLEELNNKLLKFGGFVKGADAFIESGNRDFTIEEKEKIKAVLEDEYNMNIKVKSEDEAEEPKGDVNMAIDEDSAYVIKRTIRSGQRIEHNGSIVILGDVNHGAEIIANGDIIVFGTLRGLAHAGRDGKKDGIILAYRMRATQIRIGDCIGRSPDNQLTTPELPEIAKIRQGAIIIEKYLPTS